MSIEPVFPAFPVVGWQVGPVESRSNVVVKFGYSTSPHTAGASTFDSQFFSLSPEMVRSLIYDLQRSLRECEAPLETKVA
jgi:biofilm regulator BssS